MRSFNGSGDDSGEMTECHDPCRSSTADWQVERHVRCAPVEGTISRGQGLEDW